MIDNLLEFIERRAEFFDVSKSVKNLSPEKKEEFECIAWVRVF